MRPKRRPRWGLTKGNPGARGGAGSPDIPVDPQDAAKLGRAFSLQRSDRGVTQQQVADALGISVDEVAALESGTGPLGRRELEEAIVRYGRAVMQVVKNSGGSS